MDSNMRPDSFQSRVLRLETWNPCGAPNVAVEPSILAKRNPLCQAKQKISAHKNS